MVQAPRSRSLAAANPAGNKKGGRGRLLFEQDDSYAENEEPQPQVEVAFGFLITNCSPSTFCW